MATGNGMVGIPHQGEPPLTRQMLRLVGYDFTVSDRRAGEELGYAAIVAWEEGVEQMRTGWTSARATAVSGASTSNYLRLIWAFIKSRRRGNGSFAPTPGMN
jgi:hypothetical protein